MTSPPANTEQAQRRLEEAQKALWAAEEAARDAELADKRRQRHQVMAAHQEACIQATGLRRAILHLHAPKEDDPNSVHMVCAGCETATNWDYPPNFPCPTYVLARDWREAPTDENRVRHPGVG